MTKKVNFKNFRKNMTLFLSSYTPLFVILGLQYLNVGNMSNFCVGNVLRLLCNNAIPLFFFLLCILANISLYLFISSKSHAYDKIEIKEIENKNNETLSYILPFIICFISKGAISLDDPISILIFLIIMYVIYKVYINSNLIYLNIILIILDYNIYSSNNKDKNLIILSKKYITNGSKEKVYKIADDFYIHY